MDNLFCEEDFVDAADDNNEVGGGSIEVCKEDVIDTIRLFIGEGKLHDWRGLFELFANRSLCLEQ